MLGTISSKQKIIKNKTFDFWVRNDLEEVKFAIVNGLHSKLSVTKANPCVHFKKLDEMFLALAFNKLFFFQLNQFSHLGPLFYYSRFMAVNALAIAELMTIYLDGK